MLVQAVTAAALKAITGKPHRPPVSRSPLTWKLPSPASSIGYRDSMKSFSGSFFAFFGEGTPICLFSISVLAFFDQAWTISGVSPTRMMSMTSMFSLGSSIATF